ncbi:MAG TPA: Flp pilus assembly protein CpaB [Candidatus Dormibacteraeota bacterium]
MSANAIEARPVNIPLVVVGTVVVIAAFVATVLIGQLSSRSAGVAPTTTQAVLVAARDVAPRTVLVAADLAIARYAVADVPPASLATAGAAIGLVAQTPLRKGQPVLSNQVGKDAGSGVLAAYLPLAPGVVALTVPSNEVQGVAGYVQAGDYIDIQAVVTPRSAPTANVRTIYSNIRVIRVGPAAVSVGGAVVSQQTGGLASSLTLAVTQCQAEFINWFIANAQVRYTLLAYQDYQATPAAADTTCPKAGSAGGVVEADIRSHWPGLD